MGKVVLTPALEAEFHGFQDPMEIRSSNGDMVGVFLPLPSYKKMLANLPIPYSQAELERRRKDSDGASLTEFWQTLGRQ